MSAYRMVLATRALWLERLLREEKYLEAEKQLELLAKELRATIEATRKVKG